MHRMHLPQEYNNVLGASSVTSGWEFTDELVELLHSTYR